MLVSKKRVYEISKELDISAKELIDELKTLGVEVKNHMSSIDDDVVSTIMELYSDGKKKAKKEEKIKKISSKPKPKDITSAEKKETQKEKKNIHKKEKIEKKTVKENSKKVRKEKPPEKKEEKKEEKIVKTVNIKPEEPAKEPAKPTEDTITSQVKQEAAKEKKPAPITTTRLALPNFTNISSRYNLSFGIVNTFSS